MIKSILSILNNSIELQSLFDGNNRIYSYLTDYLGECIIYQITPQQDNKKTNKIRIQFSIITETISKALEVERVIKQLLITKDDTPLNDEVLQVSQNGGGSLYDYNRNKYHYYIYLDIIGRSELE